MLGAVVFVKGKRGPADFEGGFGAPKDDASEVYPEGVAAAVIDQKTLWDIPACTSWYRGTPNR